MKSKGFIVVEFMFFIIIVAILGGIVAPALFDKQKGKQNMAVQADPWRGSTNGF